MADKDTMQQLHMLEQTLQGYVQQKQQLQSQILEVESAEHELGESASAYVIVGNIMVEKPADAIRQDLSEKRKRIELRVSAIEKQEDKARARLKDVQGKAMEEDG